MLPSVSGPTSAGPDAYAVAEPRRGVVDERVWESLCFATPPGYRPLFLDLHVPGPVAGHRPPLVVWVHGGGWESGSRRRFPVAVEDAWFLERVLLAGFAVALVDYRLVREADFPAAPDDVRTAVAWLRGHAEDFGYDGGRIVLWGESAGAHLALLAAAPDATGTTDVVAVVDWYGPTDLPALAATTVSGPAGTVGEGGEEEGGEPGFSPDMGQVMEARGWGVPESSPVNVLTADCPPVFIAHGRDDTTVPLAQSEVLRARLTGLGVPVELLETAGGHVFEGAAVIPEVIARSLDFLARTLDVELGPRLAPSQAASAGMPGEHPGTSVEDTAIESEGGSIPLRIRRPAQGSDTVVVYLHGGRGVGGLDTDRAQAARICTTVPATVVQVGCGSTSDRPIPAAHEACVAAVAWAHERLDTFGARRLVLAGAGTGADLALATALHCRDNGTPVAAVLVDHPAMDGTPGDVRGLPPVVLGVGALDSELEDALRLVRRLRESHVPTRFRIFPTVRHAYGGDATRSEAAERALEQLSRDLGQLLWDGILD